MPTTSTIEQTADRFKALADPTRLRILELVSNGEQCVCELVDRIDVAQPLLSHHLKVLRDAGFVRARREGRWTYYALDRERLDACRCVLDETLEAYDEAARLGRPGCAC